MNAPPPTLRLDKWLWHARFFKSRALAARICANGRVRRNGVPQTKPAAAVRAGDILTFPQGGRIRVVAVAALGERRGPAGEAARLYDDLAAPKADEAPSPRGGPRPTKAARRALDRMHGEGDIGAAPRATGRDAARAVSKPAATRRV